MAQIDISKSRDARMPRAEIAAEMRQNGIPDQIATEVADIASHAACKALDTIVATCEMSSTPAGRMNALSIAVALAKKELDFLEEAMKFATKACGLQTIDAVVGGQAHG